MKTLLRSIWTLLLILTGVAVQAQSPNWRAVRAISNTGAYYSTARAVAADGNGNLYVVGSYNGTISLGNLVVNYTAGQSTFIAKWNIATNTYVWAQHCGGFVNTLAVSGNNIYIGGALYGGPTVFGPYSTVYNDENAFVAKLTDNGSDSSFAWVQQFGGSSFAGVQALAVVGSSVYATGAFNTGTASFGTYTLSNASPGFNSDVFVAKLSDNGPDATYGWALQAGGMSADTAAALVVTNNSVYVTGAFRSATASFGTTTLTLTNSSDNANIFVSRIAETAAGASFV
jgi:hypothetical protein